MALAKLRASLDDHWYVEPTKITLAYYARHWLRRRQTTGKGLKPTTAANYERYINNDIVPSKLGEMKLTDIRRLHINQFAADLVKAGRGATTVWRILARLSTIFASAVKDELIGANPVVGADRPRLPDTPVQVLEPEHVREFLQRSSRTALAPCSSLPC